MSEPEEHQSQATGGQASAVHPSPAPAAGTQEGVPAQAAASQPEFGQYATRQYGAMASQFPAGYDPYLYGRPEPASPPSGQPDANQAPQAAAGVPTPQQPGAPAPAQRTIINGIDVDDPAQNPLYGRWDSGSVIALVLALFLPCPILPALLGGLSMFRTKRLHMKGYGLALAAVIINVLYSIAFFYLMARGISTDDVLRNLTGMMGGSADGSGTSTPTPSESATPAPSATGNGGLAA